MNRYLKQEGEDDIEYLLRLVGIKLEEKTDDLEWVDIVEYCSLDCHPDSLRKAMQPSYYGAYSIYMWIKEKVAVGNVVSSDNDSDIKDLIKQLEKTKREVYIARQKMRDEKNEYSAFLREQSRMEMFYDRIDEATDKLVAKKNRVVPQKIELVNGDFDVICAFADAHYDCEFKILGFNGEIINEYSTKIFEDRMRRLREEIVTFCKMHNHNHINIVDMGDSIEGILHLSGLSALKGNIVDAIMDYADFVSDWIYALSEEDKIAIDFYTSEGNHSNLRLLTGKKGDFPNENLEKIYARVIKKAFKNNTNVEVHDSVSGLNYFNIMGYDFLTAHGQDEKNIKNSIQEYEETYGIKINYFLVGHLHSKNEIEVARGKEVVQVRSMMGGNDYSTRIKKSSDAGALMFTVHKDCGKKYVNEVKFKN